MKDVCFNFDIVSSLRRDDVAIRRRDRWHPAIRFLGSSCWNGGGGDNDVAAAGGGGDGDGDCKPNKGNTTKQKAKREIKQNTPKAK